MCRCIICGQERKANAKYCLKCSRILRNNQSYIFKIKEKYGVNLCPLCYNTKENGENFCKRCKRLIGKPKNILSYKKEKMGEHEHIDISYTYIIKDPKFFRKKKKDFVSFKIIEVELRKGHIFTQDLESLYKQGLRKRERFESREKYREKIKPIFCAKYERWRDNQIRFMVDVAVEGMKVGTI